MQVSNLQSETLIKKEKPVFPCEFCKKFENAFLIEQLHASVILTLLKYDFQFLSTFHQPSLPFKEFTKLNKFGIVGKYCQSKRHFILEKKEMKFKTMTLSFLNILSKGTTIWIFSN